MRLFKSFFVIGLSALSCTTLQASTLSTKNSWFIGAGAGSSSLNLSNNSTRVSNGAPSPYNQDYFYVRSPGSQTQVQGYVGYHWHQDKKFIPLYAAYLLYRHYSSTNIKGYIDQYSLSEFRNYNYHMEYAADLWTLNGMIHLFEYKKIAPYVSLGLGVIYNHLNGYTENALANVTPRVSPGYAGNTTTNLVATFGLGVDVTLTKNVWATLGYEYLAQQGNIMSGNGENAWSNTHLTFGKNPKMNTVFINISVNIPDGIRSGV